MSGSTLTNRPRWAHELAVRFQSSVVVAAGNYTAAPAGNSGLITGPFGSLSGILIDASDYDVYERDTEFFIEYQVGSGTPAPGGNLYSSLYPVTNFGGTFAATTTTVGPEVPGARTATIAAPVANAMSSLERGPNFTLPGPGIYLPTFNFDAAFVATSVLCGAWRLGVVSV